MKYDIFISHCKENKIKTAVPLCQALSALGFRVWFDRSEILTGDAIYESIKTAICNSSIIVALIADAYLHRLWTQKELYLALELEQSHTYTPPKRVFPVYQKLCHITVEKTFSELKNRAFEVLSTDSFDSSTREGHTILDRIVFVFFSHYVPCISTKDWRWLIEYGNYAYISQLIIFFRACEHIEEDLRTSLVSYTNAIRYLLAIINELDAQSSMLHYRLIADKYCKDIVDRCFSFKCDITYEMLASCRAILWALTGDLKTILDAL